MLKVTAVYELPFGEGRRWGAGSNGFVKKLISGWEWTTFFMDPFKTSRATSRATRSR